MDRYKKERKGSQEMEEYLKMLLDNEVKPLWPKGWMQSRYVRHKEMIFISKLLLYLIVHALSQRMFRVLIWECRKMLGLFTTLP